MIWYQLPELQPVLHIPGSNQFTQQENACIASLTIIVNLSAVEDVLSVFPRNITAPIPCSESKQDYIFNTVLMNINTALYKIMEIHVDPSKKIFT